MHMVMNRNELVCIPEAIPRGERSGHFALAKELFERLAIAQEDLPQGYAVHFPSTAFQQLAAFVNNERRCCPAIRFELDVSPAGEPIILRMTGPEGAREFLKEELPIR
jgi:hypothetical protein